MGWEPEGLESPKFNASHENDTLKCVTCVPGPDGIAGFVNPGGKAVTFTEAGANGNDVFLVTRQRLVASDTDEFIDVYDARIEVRAGR